jgi:hypothetical protein
MNILKKLFNYPLTADEKPGFYEKKYSGKQTHVFIAPTNIRALKISLYNDEDNLFYEFVHTVFGGEQFTFVVEENYSYFHYSNAFPITVKNTNAFSAQLIVNYQTF